MSDLKIVVLRRESVMYRQVVVAVLVGVSVSGAWGARCAADVVWIDGRPVFGRHAGGGEPAYRPISRAKRPVYPRSASGGRRPDISPKAPQTVLLPQEEEPGTIIIDQQSRRLYYVLSSTEAFLYPISVGRDGFRWTGIKKISAIRSWPRWTPPAEMRKRQPWLPVTMSGGLSNPLGAKALYLGSSLYRIHGTNDPKSIGQASSSGCFRMMNSHVVHLATLAGVGTPVRVVSRYPECLSPQCQRERIASR